MSKVKEKEELTRAEYLKELPAMVKLMETNRAGSDSKKPIDVSLGDMVEGKWGITETELFEKIGVNPLIDTMENIFTMPDQSVRWVVPEIIRSAILLGVREAPFYTNVIAGDQPIAGLTAVMPHINMSDATPNKLNEAETFSLGTISYGEKAVNLFKVGKGIKLTDEVRSYVSLDVLSIFMRDFGIKLGYALDTLALDALINGNKLDGSESSPVIGIGTANNLAYKDLLRVWVRGSRMGRNFSTMIGGEDMAIEILDLPEFKTRYSGTTEATLNLKTPVPKNADFFIHSGAPASSSLMVDKSSALIKLTAKALSVESERIVSNQTSAMYASMTTGFSKMYQDACIVLDSTKAFSSYGFPSYMDIDPYLGAALQ